MRDQQSRDGVRRFNARTIGPATPHFRRERASFGSAPTTFAPALHAGLTRTPIRCSRFLRSQTMGHRLQESSIAMVDVLLRHPRNHIFIHPTRIASLCRILWGRGSPRAHRFRSKAASTTERAWRLGGDDGGEAPSMKIMGRKRGEGKANRAVRLACLFSFALCSQGLDSPAWRRADRGQRRFAPFGQEWIAGIASQTVEPGTNRRAERNGRIGEEDHRQQ